MHVLSLDHLVLTVRDVPAALAWYETVLGTTTEALAGADGSLRFSAHFGSQKINSH